MNPATRARLVSQTAGLINQLNIENDSNTPDFVLAESAVVAIETAGRLINMRDRWYCIHPRPGSMTQEGE